MNRNGNLIIHHTNPNNGIAYIAMFSLSVPYPEVSEVLTIQVLFTETKIQVSDSATVGNISHYLIDRNTGHLFVL